jgi:hypothetical protein
MLSLLYPVLQLTKCDELAEHMIEGVWPIQHTAADKSSRTCTSTCILSGVQVILIYKYGKYYRLLHLNKLV